MLCSKILTACHYDRCITKIDFSNSHDPPLPYHNPFYTLTREYISPEVQQKRRRSEPKLEGFCGSRSKFLPYDDKRLLDAALFMWFHGFYSLSKKRQESCWHTWMWDKSRVNSREFTKKNSLYLELNKTSRNRAENLHPDSWNTLSIKDGEKHPAN